MRLLLCCALPFTTSAFIAPHGASFPTTARHRASAPPVAIANSVEAIERQMKIIELQIQYAELQEKIAASAATSAATSVAPEATATAQAAASVPEVAAASVPEPTIFDPILSALDPALSAIQPVAAATFQGLVYGVGAALNALPGELPTLPTLPPLPTLPTLIPPEVTEALTTPILGELTPKGLALQLAAIGVFGLGNAIYNADANGEAPYKPGTSTYDPLVADKFYQERPLLVAQRLLKLGRLTTGFTAGLLWDWLVLGKLLKDEEYTALKQAEPRRAKEALVLCEQCGPTFIKLGQALSIRTDLIPEAYALELRQLQDAVPPFPTGEATAVLKEQLGVRNINDVFESLSPEPVASASIGQVYKGTLKDGNSTQVAV